jgi:3-hydroxyanthranilate 3,4-dioxygenase
MFLLPPHIPHSPQRGPNTIGLVIERYRKSTEKDSCQWYCENCNNKLYEEFFDLKDIVKQLPLIFEKFYSDVNLRTCKNCGTVMEPPKTARVAEPT